MADNDFALYGYNTPSTTKNLLTATAVILMLICLPLTICFKTPWFLALPALSLGIFLYMKRAGYDKGLLVASRYLIIGNRILYYGNIKEVHLDKVAKILTLESVKGSRQSISAASFPTNARKPPKIAANRNAKFSKVSARIIEKIKTAAPECRILA